MKDIDMNLNDIKSLYQQKTLRVSVSVQTVQTRAHEELRQVGLRHVKSVVLFVLTALALVAIDRVNATTLTTSGTGLTLLVGCAGYYAFSRLYLWRRLRGIDTTASVHDAIRRLSAYQRLNIWMHTWGEVWYTFVLMAGVYIYLQPVMAQYLQHAGGHGPLYLAMILAAWGVWVVVHVFVIKQKYLRRDTAVIARYQASLQDDDAI